MSSRALIVLVLAQLVLLASAPPLFARTAYYVEVQDPFTRVTGLKELLEHLGYTPRELKARQLSRSLPPRAIVVIGSFATADPAVRRELQHAKRAITRFLEGGGTLIQLTQAHKHEGRIPWLPAALAATRGDFDYERPVVIHPDHPLFRAKTALFSAWEIRPPGWKQASSYITASETFKLAKGFRVLLAHDERSTFPALLSARVGRGWLVLSAMAPDKVYRHGTSDQMKSEAAEFLKGLLRYYASGRRRMVFRPDATFESHPLRRIGIVFDDRNRNGQLDPGEPGLANQIVHFGLKTLRTDATGRFQLTVPADRIQTVSVHIPANKQATTRFYCRTNDPAPIEFGLAERPGPIPERYTIAQISDTHIAGWRLEKDGERLRALARELNELRPRPAFILHTGDITTSCRHSEWRTYLPFIKALEATIFHLMGNHDVSKGPGHADVFRSYLGPENYTFDYGPHRFVVGYHRYRGNPLHEWMTEQIKKSDRPVVLVIHHFPSTRFLEQVKDSKLFAIIHGDWHSSKVNRNDGRIWNVNSPTVLMGGLDHSPKSYRLITLSRDGIETDLRYTGVRRLLRIVSPSERSPRRVAVVVTAYDSADPVTGVRFRLLDEAGRVTRSGSLTRKSRLSYIAELDLTNGPRRLEVTADQQSGGHFALERRFTVADHTPRPIELKGVATMFRLNPERSGSNVPLGTPLELRWVAPTGGTVYLQSPLLSRDGLLYLSHEDRHSATAKSAGVTAFDAHSGSRRWQTLTGESILHSPLLHKGTIFAQGINGTIFALRAKDGRVRWKRRIEALKKPYYESYWPAFSPLIVAHRLLLTHPPAPVLLDPDDGHDQFLLEQLGREAFLTYSSPAVSGRTAVMGSLHHGIRAFRVGKNPKTLWTTGKFQVSATPVLVKGRVFVVAHRELKVYQLSNGTLLYHHKLPYGYNVSTPAVEGHTIYVATASGRLIAIDWTNGQSRWTFTAEKAILDTLPYRFDSPTLSSSPVIAGRLIFIGGNDGKLYAIAKESGRVVWSYDLGSPVASTPLISGNTLFVAAYDGNLYAFVRR